MLKRILKIFGIVLACAIVGLGLMIGVMFLQGKFDEPYVEPTSIYFDFEDDTLNVTYYCGNKTYDGKDASNIYSFVLKATPADVTEKLCSMYIESGAELIEFCNEKGEPLSTSLQSQIKIGDVVYFKIKSTFDNATENYENTKGEVKLYFNTSNNLCNADLKIRIDRQVSSVSLMDLNNTQNNVHVNGVFSYETEEFVEANLSEKPESWAGYYLFDVANQEYIPVESEAEFNSNLVYYTAEINDTLELNIEANTEYELRPIFAPENSNKPFADVAGKSCDIYIKNGTVYEKITETQMSVIKYKNSNYYFYGEQAGSYELIIVSYPTYENERLFNDEFDGEGVDNVIFGNKYSITRKVVINVKNSGVRAVTFNDGNTALNIPLKLFEDNQFIVNNSSAVGSITNLNINMKNNNLEAVTTRYNQIKFFEESDFEVGKITLASSVGNQKIVLGNGVATLTGFDGKNGAYSYTISLDTVNNKVVITINLDGDAALDGANDIKVEFYGIVGQAEGLYQLTYLNVIGNAEDITTNWNCNNQIILIQHSISNDGENETSVYKLGSLKVGTYLILYNTSMGVINEYFKISSSGYGMDKIFTIRPLVQLSEVQLHCLVINEDGSYAVTEQYAGVSIETAETILSAGKEADLKIKYVKDGEVLSSLTSSINVNELVDISSGSYKIPLMFVEASGAKVETISQIYYEKNGVRYCLVGSIDTNGNFVNKVVPKANTIGEETVYIMLLKYDYAVNNANDLVKNLLLELSEQTVNIGEATIDNNFVYVGGVIKIGETSCVVTDITCDSESSNTLIVDYYYTTLDNEEERIAEGRIILTDSGLFYNISNSDVYSVYKFYDNEADRINLDIYYVDQIDEFDTISNFNFNINNYILGDSEITLVDKELIVKEDTPSKRDSTDNMYFDVTTIGAINEANVLELIADYSANTGSAGLNKYYYLTINQYDENQNLYLSGNVIRTVSDNSVTYSINNSTLAKYFKIDDIIYSNAEGNNLIRVYFSVLSDVNDTFEGYSYNFVFKYDDGTSFGKTATSISISIESTAVKGYQFSVQHTDGETYKLSFDEYYLVYDIKWDTEKYIYDVCLVRKDKYENYVAGEDVTGYYIALTEDNIDSLVDDEILAITDNTSKYITALPDSYSKSEFDFLSTITNDVLTVSNGKLIINKVGDSKIVLTNSTKTSVTSSIDVKVRASAINLKAGESLEATTNEIILSNQAQDNNNLFNYYQGETNLFNQTVAQVVGETLTNVPVVSFEISNLTAGYEVQANGYGLDIVDNKSLDNESQPAVVISLSNESGIWKLIRQPNYVLHVLRFDLTVNTIAGSVTTTISYVSPVNIEKNANNDMVSLEVIEYFENTTLQLTSDKNSINPVETLYKLTDETGSQYTAFKAQYFGYKALENTETWSNNMYFSLSDGEYVLLEDEPADFSTNYSNYYKLDWIDFSDTTGSLSIKLTALNTANLVLNEVYNCRIYYNDNKFTTFKLKKIENILVEKSIKNGSENSENNPYILQWSDNATSNIGIRLADYIKLYKIIESENYLSYTNARKQQLENISFSLITDNKNYSGILSYAEEYLKIDWINYTEDKEYQLEFNVGYNSDRIRTENYFVTVTSDYSILLKKGLIELNAYSNVKINIADYFEILGGETNNICGINSLIAKDADGNIDNALSYNFNKSSGDLVIYYNGAVGGVRYLSIIFEVNKKLVEMITIEPSSWDNGEYYKFVDGEFITASESDWGITDIFKVFAEKPTDWPSENYYKLINGEFVVATEVDWGTTSIYTKPMKLTSSDNYAIEISNYRLTPNGEKLVAGEDTSFVDLIEDVNWNYIDSIEIVCEDTNIISSGSNIITKDNTDLRLNAIELGYDYSINLNVKLYYYLYTPLFTRPSDWEASYSNYFIYGNNDFDINNSIEWINGEIYSRQVVEIPYSYNQFFNVVNPSYLQVNYTFKDLVLDTANVAIHSINGEEIKLADKQAYDIALSGETIDLAEKVNSFLGKDNSLIGDRELSTISLVGVIGLNSDANFENKIVISNKTISFGEFNVVGYAIFKITDNKNTSCYYLVRVTPSYLSYYENYTAVLNNNVRKTDELEHTVINSEESSTTIEKIIDNTAIATTSGVSKTLLDSNNIYYYILENISVQIKNGDNIENASVGYSINGKEIQPTINPADILIAIVIKTTNGIVHICNYKLKVLPNIDIEIGEDYKNNLTEKTDEHFAYNWSFSYKYGDGETNSYDLANIFTITNADDTQKILSSATIDKANRQYSNLIEINKVAETSGEVEINKFYLKLLKNISTDLTFVLNLTYDDGFEVRIYVTYIKFTNTNLNSTYTMGWNGSKFVDTLTYNQLIPNYSGKANVSINYSDGTTSDNYEELDIATSDLKLSLKNNQYVATITIKLLEDYIEGAPNYIFTVTIQPNLVIERKSGYDSNSSAYTVLNDNGSHLSIEINDNSIVLSNSSTILSIYTEQTATVTSIQFKLLETNDYNNNYITGYKDGNGNILSNISFVQTATDVQGILVIAIDGYEPIEVYITISQSYKLVTNYRLTSGEYKNLTLADEFGNDLSIDELWSKTLVYEYREENGNYSYSLLTEKPKDFADNYGNYYRFVNNYDSETVVVNSSLTLEELFGELTNVDISSTGVVINSSRFTTYNLKDMSNIVNLVGDTGLFTTSDSLNAISMAIYYDTINGLVQDSQQVYATIFGNQITFNSAGVIYIRLTNATGVECYYRVIIQEKTSYYDNFTFDETDYFRMANTDDEWEVNTYYVNSGTILNPVYTMLETQTMPSDFNTNRNYYYKKIDNSISIAGEIVKYYSTTLNGLKISEKNQYGYKLASLTFGANKDNFFALYVAGFSIDNADMITDGNNSFEINSNSVSGIFSYGDSVKINYQIMNNYDIMLSINDTAEFENAYFDIHLITLNGVAQTIRLYVTDIAIEKTNNEIYANSGIVDVLANRIKITNNGNSLIFNTINANYYFVYAGAYNVTDNVRYSQGDNNLIVATNNAITNEESDVTYKYATSEFELKGVAYNTEIAICYKVYYDNGKSILLEEIIYNFIVKNDINISMNNFSASDNYYNGEIYLANYSTSTKTVTENDKNVTKTYTIVDLINNNENSYYRKEYIRYLDNKTQTYIFDGASSQIVASYMHFNLVDSYISENLKDKVEITSDGKLNVYADVKGQVGVKVTAQYSPKYSVVIVITINPSINVIQKYAENEVDDGTGGLKSGDEVNLVSQDLQTDAMFKLTKQYYTSANSELTSVALTDKEIENITLKYQVAIRSSLVETIAWDNITESTSIDTSYESSPWKVPLPTVAINSASYVTYRLVITTRGSDRIFICNYLVTNEVTIELDNSYMDKNIKAGEGAQDNRSNRLYLYDSTDIGLFSNISSTEFLNDSMLAFKNISDSEDDVAYNMYFVIKSFYDNSFYVDLTSGVLADGTAKTKIFSNSMTFDLAFVENANADKIGKEGVILNFDANREWYSVTGWTFTSSSLITSNNSMALSNFFTKSELGDSLSNKDFVGVVTEDNIPNALSLFTSTVTGDSNYNKAESETTGKWYKSEKEISRTYTINAQLITYEYEIYSIKVQSETAVSASFYSNTAIFYIIVTSEETLIQLPSNNYISKVIDDSSFDSDGVLAINVADYVKVWDISNNWLTASSTSPIVYSVDNNIASFDNGASVIKINRADISNSSYYSFNITVYSNSAYIIIRVDLTIL